MKWNGDELNKLVRKTSVQRLERACTELKNEIKIRVSDSSNHGTTPAAAGEPFHKDTGRARASISHEVDADAMVGRVGSNVDYVKFQELGTVKMPAHPAIRPTYEAMKPRLKAIMEGGG